MFKVVNGIRTPLTQEEIDQVLLDREQESLYKIEFQRTEYQRLRQEEYPSIQEQLDMMYHDKAEGTNTWFDTISAIKAKYPKPEGI